MGIFGDLVLLFIFIRAITMNTENTKVRARPLVGTPICFMTTRFGLLGFATI